MKFRRFLQEGQVEGTIDELIARIIVDCSEFLSVAGPKPIYRGVKSASAFSDALMTREAFKKRLKPRDMHRTASELIDKYAAEKFDGLKPRMESLFVTGREGVAGEYGRVFLVFPIGDFKFLYMPGVGDMYTEFMDGSPVTVYADMMRDALEGFAEFDPQELSDGDASIQLLGMLDQGVTGPAEKFFREVVDSYSNTNLAAAIDRGYEINLFCEDYYMVDVQLLEEIMPLSEFIHKCMS